jgi:HEPN superfamily RES-like protein/RES domain-containing protein
MHDVDGSEIEATYPDKFVCADCLDDDHLKAFIEDSAAWRKCTYCGKSSRNRNIAAPVDDVIQRIFDSISRRYGDAWASGSSWDNEDQRYLNETWDTEDLVSRYVELPQDDSTELYQDILNAFPQRDWSTHHPWSSTDAEILQWGWNRFVNAVKYHRRFFFTRREDEEDDILRDWESLDPGELLERFGKGCARSGLIKTILKGTTILRCRPRSRRSQRFTKARELGPPPPTFARQNRMSPAGIPMFYGSDDKQTTLAEMPELPKYYAVGTFETLKPLRVLDLTKIRPPSIFDMSEGANYDWSIFMNRFLSDFSSPIERDDRIHIDYVPTQVVTEYLRDAMLGGDPPIDGIKYLSARRRGGVCYVLFIDEYGVEPNDGDLTANEDEDERVFRKPKNGYALRLRSVTHHMQRK